MQKLKQYIGQRWPIAAVLAVVGILMLWRSAEHELVGDELRYLYTFNLRPGQSYFNHSDMHHVQTWGDLTASMANHYVRVNGRIPVHAAEMAVTAFGGLGAFYVLNTLVFMALLWLMLRLCGGRRLTHSPWAWLLTLLALLYLMPTPARLWYSVNLSLNYLWPAALALAYMLLWRVAWTRDARLCPWQCALIVVGGFVLGWSNEAFSLPLSGAVLLFAPQALREHRLRRYLLLTLPLWLGALGLILSPGNWHRADRLVGLMVTLPDILLQLRMVWALLLVALVALCVRPRSVVRFVRENRLAAGAWAVSVALALMAHTGERSFTGVELFSAVLLLRAASPLFKMSMTPRSWLLWGCIAALLIVHQGCITYENHCQQQSLRHALHLARVTVSTRVPYDYREPPLLLRPFTYHLPPTSRATRYEWQLLGRRYLSSPLLRTYIPE